MGNGNWPSWDHGSSDAGIVFEFGTGRFAAGIRRGSQDWHVILHAREAYLALVAHLPAVTPHLILPEWGEGAEETPALPGQYRRYVRRLSGTRLVYDAVVVDGKARVECALAAARALRPGGWLVFPNYFGEERYYRRAPELLDDYRLVRDFRREKSRMALFMKK